MSTDVAQLLSECFNTVRNQGTLIKRAGNRFGADQWQLGNVVASLVDDASTRVVGVEGELMVYQTLLFEPRFNEGDVENLINVHEQLKEHTVSRF